MSKPYVGGRSNPGRRVVSRKDAGAEGLDRYFTGKPCRNSHLAERYTESGTCVVCNVERKRKKCRPPVAMARIPRVKPAGPPKTTPPNPTPEAVALLRRLVEWLPAGSVGVWGPRFLARGWVESRQGAGGTEYRRSDAGDGVLRGARRGACSRAA